MVKDRLLPRGFEPAFGPFGSDCVTAVVDPANPPSARVLEKLGFTEEPPRIAYGRPHRVFLARDIAGQR